MFLIANLESERRFQDTHHSSSIATRMCISSSSHDPVYLIHSRRSSRVAEVITALTIPHLPTTLTTAVAGRLAALTVLELLTALSMSRSHGSTPPDVRLASVVYVLLVYFINSSS